MLPVQPAVIVMETDPDRPLVRNHIDYGYHGPDAGDAFGDGGGILPISENAQGFQFFPKRVPLHCYARLKRRQVIRTPTDEPWAQRQRFFDALDSDVPPAYSFTTEHPVVVLRGASVTPMFQSVCVFTDLRIDVTSNDASTLRILSNASLWWSQRKRRNGRVTGSSTLVPRSIASMLQVVEGGDDIDGPLVSPEIIVELEICANTSGTARPFVDRVRAGSAENQKHPCNVTIIRVSGGCPLRRDGMPYAVGNPVQPAYRVASDAAVNSEAVGVTVNDAAFLVYGNRVAWEDRHQISCRLTSTVGHVGSSATWISFCAVQCQFSAAAIASLPMLNATSFVAGGVVASSRSWTTAQNATVESAHLRAALSRGLVAKVSLVVNGRVARAAQEVGDSAGWKSSVDLINDFYVGHDCGGQVANVAANSDRMSVRLVGIVPSTVTFAPSRSSEGSLSSDGYGNGFVYSVAANTGVDLPVPGPIQMAFCDSAANPVSLVADASAQVTTSLRDGRGSPVLIHHMKPYLSQAAELADAKPPLHALATSLGRILLSWMDGNVSRWGYVHSSFNASAASVVTRLDEDRMVQWTPLAKGTGLQVISGSVKVQVPPAGSTPPHSGVCDSLVVPEAETAAFALWFTPNYLFGGPSPYGGGRLAAFREPHPYCLNIAAGDPVAIKIVNDAALPTVADDSPAGGLPAVVILAALNDLGQPIVGVLATPVDVFVEVVIPWSANDTLVSTSSMGGSLFDASGGGPRRLRLRVVTTADEIVQTFNQDYLDIFVWNAASTHSQYPYARVAGGLTTLRGVTSFPAAVGGGVNAGAEDDDFVAALGVSAQADFRHRIVAFPQVGTGFGLRVYLTPSDATTAGMSDEALADLYAADVEEGVTVATFAFNGGLPTPEASAPQEAYPVQRNITVSHCESAWYASAGVAQVSATYWSPSSEQAATDNQFNAPLSVVSPPCAPVGGGTTTASERPPALRFYGRFPQRVVHNTTLDVYGSFFRIKESSQFRCHYSSSANPWSTTALGFPAYYVSSCQLRCLVPPQSVPSSFESPEVAIGAAGRGSEPNAVLLQPSSSLPYAVGQLRLRLAASSPWSAGFPVTCVGRAAQLQVMWKRTSYNSLVITRLDSITAVVLDAIGSPLDGMDLTSRAIVLSSPVRRQMINASGVTNAVALTCVAPAVWTAAAGTFGTVGGGFAGVASFTGLFVENPQPGDYAVQFSSAGLRTSDVLVSFFSSPSVLDHYLELVGPQPLPYVDVALDDSRNGRFPIQPTVAIISRLGAGNATTNGRVVPDTSVSDVKLMGSVYPASLLTDATTGRLLDPRDPRLAPILKAFAPQTTRGLGIVECQTPWGNCQVFSAGIARFQQWRFIGIPTSAQDTGDYVAVVRMSNISDNVTPVLFRVRVPDCSVAMSRASASSGSAGTSSLQQQLQVAAIVGPVNSSTSGIIPDSSRPPLDTLGRGVLVSAWRLSPASPPVIRYQGDGGDAVTDRLLIDAASTVDLASAPYRCGISAWNESLGASQTLPTSDGVADDATMTYFPAIFVDVCHLYCFTAPDPPSASNGVSFVDRLEIFLYDWYQASVETCQSANASSPSPTKPNCCYQSGNGGQVVCDRPRHSAMWIAAAPTISSMLQLLDTYNHTKLLLQPRTIGAVASNATWNVLAGSFRFIGPARRAVVLGNIESTSTIFQNEMVVAASARTPLDSVIVALVDELGQNVGATDEGIRRPVAPLRIDYVGIDPRLALSSNDSVITGRLGVAPNQNPWGCPYDLGGGAASVPMSAVPASLGFDFGEEEVAPATLILGSPPAVDDPGLSMTATVAAVVPVTSKGQASLSSMTLHQPKAGTYRVTFGVFAPSSDPNGINNTTTRQLFDIGTPARPQNDSSTATPRPIFEASTLIHVVPGRPSRLCLWSDYTGGASEMRSDRDVQPEPLLLFLDAAGNIFQPVRTDSLRQNAYPQLFFDLTKLQATVRLIKGPDLRTSEMTTATNANRSSPDRGPGAGLSSLGRQIVALSDQAKAGTYEILPPPLQSVDKRVASSVVDESSVVFVAPNIAADYVERSGVGLIQIAVKELRLNMQFGFSYRLNISCPFLEGAADNASITTMDVALPWSDATTTTNSTASSDGNVTTSFTPETINASTVLRLYRDLPPPWRPSRAMAISEPFYLAWCSPSDYAINETAVCKTCPNGLGYCFGGSTTACFSCNGTSSLKVNSGYWRFSESSIEAYACPSGLCLGAATGDCGPGYESGSILCAICERGYAKDFLGKCVECGPVWLNVLAAIAFVAAGAAVISLLTIVSIKEESAADSDNSLVLLLKIFVNFVQVLGMLAEFEVNFPSYIKAYFNIVSAATGGSGISISPVNCLMPQWTFLNKLDMQLLFPVGFVFVLVFVLFLSGWKQRRAWSRAQVAVGSRATATITAPQPPWVNKQAFRTAFTVFMFLLYQDIVTQCIATFKCDDINTGIMGQRKVRMLTVDARVSCRGQQYEAHVSFALYGLAVYGAFMPAVTMIVVLWMARGGKWWLPTCEGALARLGCAGGGDKRSCRKSLANVPIIGKCFSRDKSRRSQSNTASDNDASTSSGSSDNDDDEDGHRVVTRPSSKSVIARAQRNRETYWVDAGKVFSFLIKGFRLRCWFWEFVIVLRKVLVRVLIATVTDATLQALLGIWLLTAAFIIQAYARPYVKVVHNRAEGLALMVLVVTLNVGLLFRSAQENSGDVCGPICRSVSVALLVVNLCVLSYFLLHIGRGLYDRLIELFGIDQADGTRRFSMRNVLRDVRKAVGKEAAAVPSFRTYRPRFEDKELARQILQKDFIDPDELDDFLEQKDFDVVEDDVSSPAASKPGDGPQFLGGGSEIDAASARKQVPKAKAPQVAESPRPKRKSPPGPNDGPVTSASSAAAAVGDKGASGSVVPLSSRRMMASFAGTGRAAKDGGGDVDEHSAFGKDDDAAQDDDEHSMTRWPTAGSQPVVPKSAAAPLWSASRLSVLAQRSRRRVAKVDDSAAPGFEVTSVDATDTSPVEMANFSNASSAPPLPAKEAFASRGARKSVSFRTAAPADDGNTAPPAAAAWHTLPSEHREITDRGAASIIPPPASGDHEGAAAFVVHTTASILQDLSQQSPAVVPSRASEESHSTPPASTQEARDPPHQDVHHEDGSSAADTPSSATTSNEATSNEATA